MEISHSTITQLPEDIITQILLRLPVKSLVRFKSVCKTWNHFLKTPSFISMHHKFNTVSRLLMFSYHENEDTSSRKYVFSFHSNDTDTPDLQILVNPGTNLHFLGSCNGIICYFDYDESSVFLCNPATREFKQLPPIPIDPGSCLAGFAFGFESTNIYDFKVLCMYADTKARYLIDTGHESLKAQIFTLSSNTWKQLHWGLYDNHVSLHNGGLFVANSFNFIVIHPRSWRRSIACCDIHTERFRIMELPSPSPSCGKGYFSYLLVLKKFLSAVRQLYEEDITEIWIMKDYGIVESWTKLYTIRPSCNLIRPLCFWTDKNALIFSRLGNLVSYCLDTHTELIEIPVYDYDSQHLLHQETLVSIM